MAKFYTSCSYNVEFLLSGTIFAIENSSEDEFDRETARDRDSDKFKEMYASWLEGEAEEQAVQIAENYVVLKGRDPFGVSILKEGLLEFYYKGVSLDREGMYEKSQQLQVNRASSISVEISAFTEADIRLWKKGDDESLWQQADERSQEVSEVLQNMLQIEGDLTPGGI